jgi:ubiquinone/menaquinone biosynthesis C-methylase UbiE
MKWFPLRSTSGESLAVSMAGIKLGDRLLMLGAADPLLAARLAVKTGLTGRACVVDEREESTAKASEVATREGALIEATTAPLTSLPLESGAFDVAVLRDALPSLAADRRAGCVSEVLRVLRPGGRALVIDTARGSFARKPDYAAQGGPLRLLESQGFRAARILAERDGLVFAEAIKGNVEVSPVNP